MRKFRWSHRRTPTHPVTGKHALSFGLRVGYWPCLKAPFLGVDLATHRLEFWHGLPSYKVSGRVSR